MGNSLRVYGLSSIFESNEVTKSFLIRGETLSCVRNDSYIIISLRYPLRFYFRILAFIEWGNSIFLLPDYNVPNALELVISKFDIDEFYV